MNRPRKPYLTEPETGPASPWIEAAIRAKDPNAFLMSLGETEFAVLLAELDARRLAAVAAGMPGRQCRNGQGKRNSTRTRFNGPLRSSKTVR